MSYCKYTVSDKRSASYERYYSSKNQVVNFLRHQGDSASSSARAEIISQSICAS